MVDAVAEFSNVSASTSTRRAVGNALSRRDIMKIARRFNAGNAVEESEVPTGRLIEAVKIKTAPAIRTFSRPYGTY